MNPEYFEWLLLLGRWLHIVTGVTWIGTSFFFMWLDRSFENGELWMVHGGGFYQVKKHQMGPTKVPDVLHWFKWESYWTWMSGIFLLVTLFYAGNGTFLLDSSVSNITFDQALFLSVGSVVVSWIFYDTLWESKLVKTKAALGHALTLLWFGGVTYLLCHTLSGRAAYIHIGGMLGTWMTANVFLRIIPRQVLMVEASKRGEPVNQDWGKNAKNRSTHNTYFTLPVIFIMLSNHFPNTYGHPHNWLVLLMMSAAGASIREFFISRVANPIRAKRFLFLGAALIIATIALTTGKSTSAVSNVPKLESHTAATINKKGSVHGFVSFKGTPPTNEKLALPLVCTNGATGPVDSNAIQINEGKVRNVLVRIVKGLEGKTFTDTPPTPAVLDQVNCQYEPRMLVARVGQKVEIINSDPTFHNVKAITENNEEFNDAMPAKNDRIIKVFAKPEIFIQTKCSVHPWMSARIAVVDHPYATVTDQNGEFGLDTLPKGKYTLEIWHEVFGSKTTEIEVKENETLELNLEFTK